TQNTIGFDISLAANIAPKPNLGISASQPKGRLLLSGAIDNGGFGITTSGAGTIEFGGQISGAGNLLKLGAGQVILDQGNTYAGGTTINAGTLVANNTSGSATGIAPVVVNNAATLAGDGLVGDVTLLAGM